MFLSGDSSVFVFGFRNSTAMANSIFVFQVISFDLIRVDSPLVLVINGKKACADMQAGVELSTFTKSN